MLQQGYKCDTWHTVHYISLMLDNDETQNRTQEQNKEWNEKFLLEHSARAPVGSIVCVQLPRANQQLLQLEHQVLSMVRWRRAREKKRVQLLY